MSKVHDNIIRDLLPLYIDKVCSEETITMVEAHLETSKSLREELDKMRADLRIPRDERQENRKDAETIKEISRFWNRSKWKSFLKGAAISVLVCGVLLLGYIGLFRWSIVPVPSEVIAISDVGRLENGKIAYHIALTDGYESNRAKFEMDEEGNFYVVPYRPLIKSKAKVDIAVSYYSTLDYENYVYSEKYDGKEISALYYGKPEDSVLVWKKGSDVPAASEKVEAWFQP
ncbi:putative zinc finger protein [Fontibacillus phaseoli]|uniref:Putative zinc finger protein n=1 Tax=Fontibacillus phaseoli TaxID=1416533 RepID=A0A369B478_9BACL|nr:zf-HC2 domain-containing protein [Fontibacillus phaseoli]RCX15368.1 putative zinc finger protein [Fontibacillus phaseoli]